MRRDLATIEQLKASNRKPSESFEDLDDDMRQSRLDGNPQCLDLSLYVTLSSFPLASRPIVCTAKWSLRHMQAAHSACSLSSQVFGSFVPLPSRLLLSVWP